MNLKIGQREVSTWLFLIVTIIAVIIGKPPEATLDIVLQVVTPLLLIAATLWNIIETIQARVKSGELKPGSFFKSDGLLTMREFWYAVAVLLVGAVSIGFRDILHIEFSEENKKLVMDLLWNGGMIVGNFLIMSFAKRASTTPKFVDGDLRPAAIPG